MGAGWARRIGPALVAVLVVLFAGVAAGCGGSTDTRSPSAAPATSSNPSSVPSDSPDGESTDPESGLAWVGYDELPPPAWDTLDLIAEGGPYPYHADGSVFENREGLLPPQRRGYYHEFTVRTPGSDDRGARRIVSGSSGEYYYTEDHYQSFRRIRL